MAGKECCACWAWINRNFVWVIGLSLVMILWGGWLGIYWTVIFGDHTYREIAGLFGDSYGAVNALFSGTAMLGAVYAVWLQHRELASLQRKMEEEKEVGLISAQPYLRFMTPNSPDQIFEEHVNIHFWNYRAMATGVRCTFPIDGCTVEIYPPDVFLVQPMLHDRNGATGKFTLKFTGKLKDQWKNSPENIKWRFDLEYRDALGRKQLRKLDFFGKTEGTSLKLAEGYSWDTPKDEAED